MGSKSRRLRALEGICRTMSDLLDERVERAAKARGLQEPPQDTTRIFQIASADAPWVLDRLLMAHHEAAVERGLENEEPRSTQSDSDLERRRMLSAVRATVKRAGIRARGR
jgi:hypothetical protein